ncbi:hypothetical protein [Aquihabitans sp. McL0605]|uniref:hypothetical protein n=1 Tax=Aquihabitans sp. McL0605 TaxID=3415671 RepID=UPI003CE81647
MASPQHAPVRPVRPADQASAAAWLLALFGPVAIWASAVWLTAMAISPDVVGDRCEGIGWGCTLSPRDGVLFAGAYVGLFLVPIATAITLIGAGFGRGRATKVVGTMLGLFTAGVVVLAVAIVAAPPNS